MRLRRRTLGKNEAAILNHNLPNRRVQAESCLLLQLTNLVYVGPIISSLAFARPFILHAGGAGPIPTQTKIYHNFIKAKSLKPPIEQ